MGVYRKRIAHVEAVRFTGDNHDEIKTLCGFDRVPDDTVGYWFVKDDINVMIFTPEQFQETFIPQVDFRDKITIYVNENDTIFVESYRSSAVHVYAVLRDVLAGMIQYDTRKYALGMTSLSVSKKFYTKWAETARRAAEQKHNIIRQIGAKWFHFTHKDGCTHEYDSFEELVKDMRNHE